MLVDLTAAPRGLSESLGLVWQERKPFDKLILARREAERKGSAKRERAHESLLQ